MVVCVIALKTTSIEANNYNVSIHYYCCTALMYCYIITIVLITELLYLQPSSSLSCPIRLPNISMPPSYPYPRLAVE